MVFIELNKYKSSFSLNYSRENYSIGAKLLLSGIFTSAIFILE
ncbi:hypothetical protein FEM08_31830 [Flavobacterium gilvum]|nr:hypothetical protein FEM08_31830 [Flavobacterium gilvum]